MPDLGPKERKRPEGTASTSVHYHPDGSMEIVSYDDAGKEIERTYSAPKEPPAETPPATEPSRIK